ncbi:PH domain-containing protein [Teratosphaeria destructans]|uniref:PH domain-containing protein n=1 Tax=Teratosphaeria destructans TaxID=418781 RepID=A0A9W7W2V5_9PEZI|nr:PH domain-containing protein [Teratosphaeria destructans]
MASPTSPHNTNLPTRSITNSTEGEDAIPDEDTSETTKLFQERLQAWKHACGYLEDYVKATEKTQEAHGKEYEKVLKTVSHPLKEGHHFDQSLGGVAGMFDNIRSNTQGISNSHVESAKTLKGSVLPIFERLHSEIKNKQKELSKGAGKGAKAVDKARGVSQKHIELLGEKTAAYDSSGGNVKASEDPYLLQRQVHHRLNKQVAEENNNRDDMLSVQSHFAQFEAHVVQTFQNGLAQFNQVVSHQAEQTRTMYGDMLATTQRISPDFEWNGFVRRNNNVLIDPSASKRSVENIAFPNQDHAATQPLIAGSLEKKGKLFKKYDTGYYVVTPSKYMHEFKTDDDFAKDPTPENSLYLPDCLIGAVDGANFNVKGKDASKGALASKMSMSHEYAFKAHTPEDARKWHDVIASVAGGSDLSPPGGGERVVSGASTASSGYPEQTAGTTGAAGVSAATAAPGTAGASELTTAEKEAAGYGSGKV